MIIHWTILTPPDVRFLVQFTAAISWVADKETDKGVDVAERHGSENGREATRGYEAP
jgi:hypothetical protein